MATVVPM